MKSYVPVTFGFLGLAFYVASGGGSFEPQARIDLTLPAPVEVVTRASSEPTLAALTDLPVIAPVVEAAAEAVVAPDVAPADESDPVDVTVVVTDLRDVTADVVNMRAGAGTEFDVVEKLTRGTVVDVIEAGADGWLLVRVQGGDAQGWVAARFLTDAVL